LLLPQLNVPPPSLLIVLVCDAHEFGLAARIIRRLAVASANVDANASFRSKQINTRQSEQAKQASKQVSFFAPPLCASLCASALVIPSGDWVVGLVSGGEREVLGVEVSNVSAQGLDDCCACLID
jgi:hypothetical protein